MEHITFFHDKLKQKMDTYVHLVYRLTRKFPKEELYGVTSQYYIEGYARIKSKVYKNFLETSYASLKESKYLLHFSLVEKYLTQEEYKQVLTLADEIGAMLWSTLTKL